MLHALHLQIAKKTYIFQSMIRFTQFSIQLSDIKKKYLCQIECNLMENGNINDMTCIFHSYSKACLAQLGMSGDYWYLLFLGVQSPFIFFICDTRIVIESNFVNSSSLLSNVLLYVFVSLSTALFMLPSPIRPEPVWTRCLIST